MSNEGNRRFTFPRRKKESGLPYKQTVSEMYIQY